jgi:hypothetical protein
MANQTDKFNTSTFITNNAPPQQTAFPSSMSFKGPAGPLGSVPIDPVTNQAIYRQVIGSAGVQTVSSTFLGGNGYIPGGKDNYTLHIGSSTQSTVNTVNQIVAGPGIYISAPNGQGVVTISTSPIPTTLTQDNLYDVRWTITDPDHVPSIGDQSQFTVGGANGLNLRSRDGVNFVEMGSPPQFGIGGNPSLANAVTLQSSEFGAGGTVYWDAVPVTVYGQNSPYEIISIWGRLANTSSFGVTTGDGFNIIGSNFQKSGVDITGEFPFYCNTFYKSGSFANALHLITTAEGAIYSVTEGYPFSYFNSNTNDGSNIAIPLREEYNDSSSIFVHSASNIIDQSTSSYGVIVVGSNSSVTTGVIAVSNFRNSNRAGTWTISTASSALSAIVYSSNYWVIVGYNDIIGTSLDGYNWTWTTSGWPGSVWNSVCYGNGKFVAVGDKGRVIYSSDNGVTWTKGQSGTANNLNAIAYSPSLNKFVAVGDKRTIVTVNG